MSTRVRTAAGGTGAQRALVALGGPLADAALAATLASSPYGRESTVARIAELLAVVALLHSRVRNLRPTRVSSLPLWARAARAIGVGGTF